MGQMYSSSSSSSESMTESYTREVSPMKEVVVDYNVTSPRFSIHNTEEVQQGIEHLNEYGYAVFSNVLTNDEVNHSVDLFWQFLENLEQPYPIRRNDSQTWNKCW